MLSIEQRGIINMYLPPQGGTFVGHQKDGDLKEARLYLGQQGVSFEELDTIFCHDGAWKPQPMLDEDIYSLPPRKMDRLLRARFAPIYGAVDRSLSQFRPGGFNLHGQLHIDNVTKTTIQLLQSQGAEGLVMLRTIASARSHDLANLISRSYHALLSPEIFQWLVPEITFNESYWRIIRQATMLHNTPCPQLASNWDNLSVQERIDWIRKLGPETNALFIGDKTDIGRQRVSELPYDVSTLGIDPHTEANLLGRTNLVRYFKKDKRFVWELEFAPGITEKDREKFPHYCRKRSNHEGWRAMASPETQGIYRDNQIPHFDIWRSQFWNLYLPNVERVIYSAFALYPGMRYFHINFRDNEDFTQLRHSIKIGDIEEFIQIIKTKYLPKAKRRAE